MTTPVLTDTSPSLGTVLEGATDPAGISIAALVVDGSITSDGGLEAIAVEAVDTSLLTTSAVGQPPTLSATDPLYYGWGWWWFSNTDLRDEKVVLFATYLPKGTYEYTYTLHASLPGTYQVIPTQAREFYFPEVFGHGDGVVFTIRP